MVDKLYIVLFGDLIKGFEAFGPFANEAVARSYAENSGVVMPMFEATRALALDHQVMSIPFAKMGIVE